MKTQIAFMNMRKQAAVASIVLVIASFAAMAILGIQRSVDFAGGTKLLVAFEATDIAIGDVREVVTPLEPKATITSVESAETSSFSIKIKRPEVEEGKASEASLQRLRNLERAFSTLKNDDRELLELLAKLEPAVITTRLATDNDYNIVGEDAAIRAAYQTDVTNMKAALGQAQSLQELVQTAKPDAPEDLAQALRFAYPSINRATADLLNEYLKNKNPLNRAEGEEYRDLADRIDVYRESKSGFVRDWEDLFANLDLEGEQAETFKTFALNNFTLGRYKVLSNETFSPSIASEMLGKATWSIVFAMLGILLYVGARFSMSYAIASIVALLHDVIIALGFFAVVQAELSNPVVAAFLTIVGYSLNDTIVVFDRIRENLAASRGDGLADLMNASINQTLSRTLVTSLTTFFVVLMVFLASNATLRDFAFPLLVGVVVGTYSSIFVASPTLLYLSKRLPVKQTA